MITFQRGRSKVGRTKPRGRKSPSPLHHHDTDIDTRRNNKKSTIKLYSHLRSDFGLRISVTIKNVRGALKNKLQTYLYHSLLLFQGTKVDSPLSNQEPDIQAVLFSCFTSTGNVHQGSQSSIHSRKRAKIRVRLHAWVHEYPHKYMLKIFNFSVSAPNSN